MIKRAIVYNRNCQTGYYGIQIEVSDLCSCLIREKENSLIGDSENKLTWENSDFIYGSGTSCIGQKIRCKHCGKAIGIAKSDSIIGTTRTTLGDDEDKQTIQELLSKDVHKQHAQKDNAIITFIKRIQKHFHSVNS